MVVEVRASVRLPGPWSRAGPGLAVGDRAVAVAEDALPVTGRATGSRAERGSAGLLVVWVSAVVMAVTTAALVWGAALAARHRAAQAADLAALAAARDAASVTGRPCPAAERVARHTGAVVRVCDLLPDGSVLVVVELAVPGVLPGLDMPPARARARAGALPVDQRSR